MTPQARLKARLAEGAAAAGVRISAKTRKGANGTNYYLTIFGDWEPGHRFITTAMPSAWITSGGPWDTTYGLAPAEVAEFLRDTEFDPAWLQWNHGVPLDIARGIRAARAFDRLPILADTLEEAGCTNAVLLDHCRASLPHDQTCWVVELLLGAVPKRKART
jgi:hypothetical protein